MQSLVVFFALAAVACGSIIPLAQPAHHPALVLDPHGRPLDTAEVINARALHLQAKALEPLGHSAVIAAPVAHAAVVAPAVVAAPAAVSHQSRVDVHSSPAIVGHVAHGLAAPLLSYSAHGLAGHGLAGHGLAGLGHLLKKRSLGHGEYSAPLAIGPAAVSHQSRVDVVSSPAVVSHAVAPVVSYAVVAPVLAHAIAPAAVSHQSRVDVRSSPAVIVHGLAAPLLRYSAHGLAGHELTGHELTGHELAGHELAGHKFAGHELAGHELAGHELAGHELAGHELAGHGHAELGHLLKKRSLGHWAYSAPLAIAPAAISHQSRVDVVSNPAVVSHPVAPVVSHAVAAPVLAHAIAPAAVSHQSRVDIRSSPAIVAHSVVAVAPLAHTGALLHATPLAHGAGHLVHGW